jgi:ATP synthase F1 gamma subunit
MIDNKSIQKDMKQLNTLESVSRIYAEVASLRMKRTRSTVLLSREFLQQINDVFEDVRASYAQDLSKLGKKRRRNDQITFLSHNGKSVAVFLSSNGGLYGNIIAKSFAQFITDVESKTIVERPEVTIIGRQGLSMFQAEQPDMPYTYFELPDKDISLKDLVEVIRHIVQYEQIQVYFGKYQSVVRQSTEKLDISAQILPTSKVVKKRENYLFEPDIEQILRFFETEIFASLFEQTVKEAQLARYASRILAMDQASENIKKEIKKLEFESMRLGHRIQNRKQLNTLSSAYLVNYGQNR